MSASSRISQSFADRLRATRKARGLSQADLAERTGLQPSAVSHFEMGRRVPSSSNLRKLADALSVTTDFLLGREQVATPAGPAASQMFRNFAELAAIDQDRVAEYVKLLAGKQRGGKK